MNPQWGIKLCHHVMNVQRGPKRPFRIVRVGYRCAEHRHHRIADMLVDSTAITANHVVDDGEELV